MKDFKLVIDKDTLFSREEGVERPVRLHTALNWNRPDGDRKLLVNFVGPNGAGKSIFPKMLCGLDPEHYWVKSSETNAKIATVCPNLGWACVGFYRTKCGGADSLMKNEIMESLYRLVRTNLHVVLDGVIVSNTLGTYWDHLKAVKELHSDRIPTFVMFDYSYETYLSRVLVRNGGKPINEDMLRAKYKNIKRYMECYKQDGGLPIHLESTDGVLPMIQSVSKFLKGLISDQNDEVLDALLSL